MCAAFNGTAVRGGGPAGGASYFICAPLITTHHKDKTLPVVVLIKTGTGAEVRSDDTHTNV